MCGVFFDVGASACSNIWCKPMAIKHKSVHVDNLSIVKVEKIKKSSLSKKYIHKAVPKHVSRWISIVGRSKKKSLICDLELEDIKYIIESSCIYCGSDERIEVDRMNSAEGYTKLNTVPACRRCNTIKNNVVTYEEMMTIVDILGWR